MKQKVNRNKAMLAGAVATVAAFLAKRSLGLDPSPINSIGYWMGALIGGALLGLVMAAIINRTST